MKKEKVIKRINPLFLKGVCHRGLHGNGVCENSLLAFKKARDNNMAFEFDVHLSKDNRLVVIHDSETERVTSKKGIIEEMSVEEIQTNYTLIDGQKIPTLEELLKENNEAVPIVLEIKVYKNNYKEVAKQVVKELSVIKDKKNVMIISFDPRALVRVKSLKMMRSLLVFTGARWVYRFRHFFESIDVEDVLLKEKEYQKYSKRHLVNTWTIEKDEQLNNVINYADMVTFQHMDVTTIKETLTKKNQKFLNN